MLYQDATGFAADFEGRLQVDRSGVGHGWRDVSPENPRVSEIMGCLADEAGEIADGATGEVGGERYRARR